MSRNAKGSGGGSTRKDERLSGTKARRALDTPRATCTHCTFVETHGYSPPGEYHCPDCHATWKGLSAAHCVQCCHTFTSDTAFDLHLEGDGCKDPASARRKNGMALYRLIQRADGPAWAIAPVSHSPYAKKGA